MAPSANYRLSLLLYAVLTIGSPIANHLAEQIRRLESSIETDPSLAIGTAKELIETCCKTILAERGKPVDGTSDVSTHETDNERIEAGSGRNS
jgi:hypothetical protein